MSHMPLKSKPKPNLMDNDAFGYYVYADGRNAIYADGRNAICTTMRQDYEYMEMSSNRVVD